MKSDDTDFTMTLLTVKALVCHFHSLYIECIAQKSPESCAKQLVEVNSIAVCKANKESHCVFGMKPTVSM